MSDDNGFEGPDSELSGAGDIAESVGGVADTVSKVASGEVAEAGLGAAGLVAGALGEDARQVSDVGSASSSLLGAGRDLGSGAPTRPSSGAVGSASDPARYIVPEREAQQLLSGGGQGDAASRGAAEALDGLDGAGTSDELGLVELHLEVADATGHWGIEHVALSERMNAVPRCDITATYAGRVEASDLLRKDVALTVELGSYRRDFKGVVWHARTTSHDVEQETTVHLTVMPAMAYLGERVDSHIYQDCTVVDVIKAVYEEVLGGLTRTIDDEFLQRNYETREYVVQYQETHLAFISRLAEEEGIFWFLDHEGEREVLVLADAVGGLPRARADHGGKVAFQTGGGDAHGGEAAFAARHYETVGATDSVVSDYDWTNPSLEVKGEQKGRSDEEPSLEILTIPTR